MLERKIFGVLPEQFIKLYQKMELAIKTNRRCKKLDILAVEKSEMGNIEIYMTLINSPTMLISERVFIDAKYIFEKEMTIIMSS